MEITEKIDFVIPWVDGGDKEWLRQRTLYANDGTIINEAQYRDWGILKYWFRCVEQYAPWVNKIYFVTCGQMPYWLNSEHPKLICVNHTDYIPKEYLPTFSSHTIELNFHRIPGLQEHFVYFNDDVYINAPVAPSDFFRKGYPCESPILSMLSPSVPGDPYAHFLCNDISVINKYFRKREVICSALWKWFYPDYGKYLMKNVFYFPLKAFSSFHTFHIASPMRKSTFEKVWELEPELLDKTCRNKFRGMNDVNQYVMSWYNICKGEFVPKRADAGKFYTIGQTDDVLFEDLLFGKHKLICINDNPGDIENIELTRKNLVSILERKLPKKSTFEK